MISQAFKIVTATVFLAGATFSTGFSQTPQVPIAIKKIAGSNSGPVATTVLQSALSASGSFKLVSNPSGVPSTDATLTAKGMSGKLMGADGKKIFERSYARGNFELDALQFADDITLALTKKPGIATSQITFVVNRNNRRELFICDYDGRNSRSLIANGDASVAPAISADGKQVAYSALNRGVGSLIVRDLATGKSESLNSEPIYYAQSAWAPDGKTLAVAMASVPNKNADLFLIKMKGRRTPKSIIETPVSESNPCWSPDGKSIVYAAPMGPSRKGLFIVNATSGNPKPKPLPTGLPNCDDPNWSPDGTRIAFDSTDHQGRRTVCITSAKGGGAAQRLAAGSDPAWGANSRHLIYTTGLELRRLDIATGKSVILVKGVGPISEPGWTR